MKTTKTPLKTLERLISEQVVLRGVGQISKLHKWDISNVLRAYHTSTTPSKSNEAHAEETVMRSAQLVGVGNWMLDRVQERLAQLERELESEIRQDDPAKNGTDRLFANATKRIGNAFDDIRDDVDAQLVTVGQTIGQSHALSLSVHHDKHAKPKTLEPGKLNVLGLTLDEHFKKLGDDALVRFKSQIRIGLDSGETADELVKRIVGTDEPVKAGERDELLNGLKTLGLVHAAGPLTLAVKGVLDTSLNSFSPLIQNAISSAAHDIESGLFDDLGEEDTETMGLQWVCALENTCEQCLVFDGSQWDADMNPVGDSAPYPGDPPEAMHPNCRCKTVPVDLTETAIQSKGMDDFFNKQSPEVLAASFGKAPARAFLEGDIDGRSLLNSGFKLSPEAFARLRPTLETI